MSTEPSWLPDGLDAEVVLSLRPDSRMAPFNRAGLLAAADIHVASAIGRLGGDGDELVALAVALAVRAPRVGHVLADLHTVRDTAIAGIEEQADLSELPWPLTEPWLDRLRCSPLVAVGEDGPGDRPVRLVGSSLYLDRYWRDETDVAVDLIARSDAPRLDVDRDVLAEGLARLYYDSQSGLQRQAVITALERHLSVIAGGPGTGKTTTVARLLALVIAQALSRAEAAPLIALAAPTGKAAARMAEAVHDEARKMDVDAHVREMLLDLGASTVHRLLGRRPGSSARFRHDRNNMLPHDVVIIDETSMMSLPLMARLVEAVRPDARLVLVGDQEQLASVEAGAVLGDIVGPAAAWEPASTGAGPPSQYPPPAASRVGECITVLRANYRFSGQLAELAGAIRGGDEEAVLASLTNGPPIAGPPCTGSATAGAHRAQANRAQAPRAQAPRAQLPGAGAIAFARWLAVDPAETGVASLEPVLSLVAEAGAPLLESARHGDGPGALDALDRFRLLCAHREGPAGVSTWNFLAEQCLAAPGLQQQGEGPAGNGLAGPAQTGTTQTGTTRTGTTRTGTSQARMTRTGTTQTGASLTERGWYVGRPVIVTENDYGLGLFNGDTGVVIARDDGGLSVVFRRAGGIMTVSPSRLSAVETAFAMTVHRAQGSEFDVVVVLLPSASSRVLTRELLYTAVTRARHGLFLVGTEASVRAAVSRPIARASGLTARLWGPCP